jgi:hypothetical protein
MTAKSKHDVSRAEWTAERLGADPTTTLSQARGWLEVRFKKKGGRCPCCQQEVKRYDRFIYSSVARGLIEMYQYIQRPETANAWLRVGQHFLQNKIGAAKGGDIIKTRYWGLIERKPDEDRRADGSDRIGMWRLTERGRRYVMNDLQVPKVAFVYNNVLLGFKSENGELVKDFEEAVRSPRVPKAGIVDALGKKFDYQEIMGTEWRGP